MYLQLLWIVAGIFLGQYLAIHDRLREHHPEYIARAFRTKWQLVSVVFIIQTAVASLVFRLLAFLHPRSMPDLLSEAVLGVLVGSAVAFGLVGSEKLLAKVDPQEQLWTRNLFRLLLKARLAVLQDFERVVQEFIEDDNFAWQYREGDWDFGVDTKTVKRRLRKLYECRKFSFAVRTQRPSLLFFDVGHYPERKFYLLAKSLGPSKLKKILANPVSPPNPEWDGSERRRRRTNPDNLGPGRGRRIYDDPELLERIRSGTTEQTSPV